MYYPQQVQPYNHNELWQHPMGHPGIPLQQHVLSPPLTAHWQNQLIKYEVSRGASSPHHRARSNQIATRSVAKSAIPITNPNARPPLNNTVSSTNTTTTTTPAGGDSTPDVNHPSSTVAPISQAPRPTASRPSGNNWSSLDMGGMSLKHLPLTSALWKNTFLTNLYLNHNSLTTLPPTISTLRHLELLDVSANSLTALPPELGMLTSLKELLVFDNHLTTLPHELGTLHQLQTLGIEGNPLDPHLKSMVQENGTSVLISYLRDSCPVPAPPPARIIKPIHPPPPSLSSDTESFSVLSYNILCEKYATERLYGYTPQWALDWSYRKELILTEIINYNADFMCLQEVDGRQFDEFFTRHLGEKGYEGVHWPKGRAKTMGSDADRKSVDGCATFYKADKYQLIEKRLVEFSTLAMQRTDFKKTEDMFNRVLGKDQIATICLFENRETNTRFIISNVHIHWDPQYADVKLVQVALMVDQIEEIAERFAKLPPRKGDETKRDWGEDGRGIPLVIAGDFNSSPWSGVYDFLSTGQLSKDHPEFLGHTYGRYTSEGLRHRLNLRSAYNTSTQPPPPVVNGDQKLTPNGHPHNSKKEPGNQLAGRGELLSLTNSTPSFKGILDYMWYSASTVAVNSVLGEIDEGYLDGVVGFPNAHFPSDHICLMSEFRVKTGVGTGIGKEGDGRT